MEIRTEIAKVFLDASSRMYRKTLNWIRLASTGPLGGRIFASWMVQHLRDCRCSS